MIEVEKRFKIEDKHAFTAALEKAGAKKVKEQRVEDLYFCWGPLEEEKEGCSIVRVRRKGDKAFIDYKRKRGEHYDEISIPVGNAEDAEKIFAAIGMTPVMFFDKVRTEFEAQQKGFYIAVDDVKRAGCFAEVELMVENEKDVAAAEKKINAFVSSLPLKVVPSKAFGYIFRELVKKDAQYKEYVEKEIAERTGKEI